jgi:hypothetical protein
MPRKVRGLKADLKRAGYVQLQRRGKGSHTVWKHPLVAGSLPLSGADGDDAKPYQEDDVRTWLEKAQIAEQEARGNDERA